MLQVIIGKYLAIMKKLIQSFSIIGTTGLTMAILLGNRPTNALTFAFSQSGWQPGGGEVMGTFSGEDKNGDDMIVFDPDPLINEVSAYELNFAGNSTFANFTHNLDNIDLDDFFLEYALGTSSGLIVSIGNRLVGNTSNYDSEGLNNMAIINQDGQPNPITTDTTENPVNISIKEVSEPRSWIGLMLFGLGAYFKRKINTRFFD